MSHMQEHTRSPVHAQRAAQSKGAQTLQMSGDSSPPLVFLSSFDSSCLEFRMLMPLLEAAGAEAYAVDLVGWGFTEARVDPASQEVLGPAERRAHLLAFCREKVTLVVSSMAFRHSAVWSHWRSFNKGLQ